MILPFKHMSMKKLIAILSITFFGFLFSCSDKKNSSRIADDIAINVDTEVAEDLTSEQKTIANFTINGKTYTCDEVSAIGYKDDNTLEITAKKSDTSDNTIFTFSLKNLGKGQQKFNATGTLVTFIIPETTFTNVYKPGCDSKEVYTEGTITITTLTDNTIDKEGKIEANFEGQVAFYQSVTSNPCGIKAEIVNVKGSVVGLYVRW